MLQALSSHCMHALLACSACAACTTCSTRMHSMPSVQASLLGPACSPLHPLHTCAAALLWGSARCRLHGVMADSKALQFCAQHGGILPTPCHAPGSCTNAHAQLQFQLRAPPASCPTCMCGRAEERAAGVAARGDAQPRGLVLCTHVPYAKEGEECTRNLQGTAVWWWEAVRPLPMAHSVCSTR